MTNKEYKAIFVPKTLHQKIKIAALKKNITMIEYLLLTVSKK